MVVEDAHGPVVDLLDDHLDRRFLVVVATVDGLLVV